MINKRNEWVKKKYPDKRTYQDRKEYKLKKERLDSELLTDRHVIKVIKRNSNLTSSEIRQNKEFIELYRLRLQLKRELKKWLIN